MKKILIMGLPGSGKTTLASELVPLLNAKWLNNDKVRKAANDWDFSEEGRARQAKRMDDLVNDTCLIFYLTFLKTFVPPYYLNQ